jgi:hypothetical protein
VRSSGKQIETDKASRADMLKVSFTIAANQLQNQEIKHIMFKLLMVRIMF